MATEAPRSSPPLPPAGRVFAALAGVAAAAAMLLFGGLYAMFTTCSVPDGEPAVCGSLANMVGPLELVAVLGGTAAAFAGGIATGVTGRARWIAGGLAITAVLAGLLVFLVGMQVSAD